MADQFETDESKSQAYHLVIQADAHAKQGDLDAARKAVAQAATLDSAYEIHARHFAQPDDRKISLTPVIKKLLVPMVEAAGFGLVSKPFWFHRKLDGWEHGINFGPTKFGGRIAFLANRFQDPKQVHWFDPRKIGNRSGDIYYTTRAEVEAACRRIAVIFHEVILPWYETGEYAPLKT